MIFLRGRCSGGRRKSRPHTHNPLKVREVVRSSAISNGSGTRTTIQYASKGQRCEDHGATKSGLSIGSCASRRLRVMTVDSLDPRRKEVVAAHHALSKVTCAPSHHQVLWYFRNRLPVPPKEGDVRIMERIGFLRRTKPCFLRDVPSRL